MEAYDTSLADSLDTFINSHQNRRLTHYDLDNRYKLEIVRDAFARLFMPYL